MSLFIIKLLLNRLLGSHHTNFGHLFLTNILLSLLKQETAHQLLVIFLASYVAKKVDTSEPESDQTHRNVVKTET